MIFKNIGEVINMATSYPRHSPAVPPPPMDEPAGTLVYQKPPKKPYLTMILAGLAILIIGGIIAASAGFLNDPLQPDRDDFDDDGDYDEAQKEFREDQEKFQDNTRYINAVGNVVQYIGLLAFGIGMITGALSDDKLSQNTKMGMFIAMAIIIGFKIAGSITYYYF
jgi:hypothetical protein